ncbi:hypothetical protein ACIQ7D_36830 [Streptomyces sp. NPDC096310]|uniref:hypothetical protein n=1 Tax=Streptomyces sp. NPDC096310 TaxID=3366082 RepID=UPI0037F7FEA6
MTIRASVIAELKDDWSVAATKPRPNSSASACSRSRWGNWRGATKMLPEKGAFVIGRFLRDLGHP